MRCILHLCFVISEIRIVISETSIEMIEKYLDGHNIKYISLGTHKSKII